MANFEQEIRRIALGLAIRAFPENTSADIIIETADKFNQFLLVSQDTEQPKDTPDKD